MGYGGDYYDMERGLLNAISDIRKANADPQPAATIAKEAEFIATERRGMAADAYADIARRLKELQAERGE